MIDIRKQQKLIDRINDILNAGGIAEVKRERNVLKVVEQRRVVAYPNDNWTPIRLNNRPDKNQ